MTTPDNAESAGRGRLRLTRGARSDQPGLACSARNPSAISTTLACCLRGSFRTASNTWRARPAGAAGGRFAAGHAQGSVLVPGAPGRPQRQPRQRAGNAATGKAPAQRGPRHPTGRGPPQRPGHPRPVRPEPPRHPRTLLQHRAAPQRAGPARNPRSQPGAPNAAGAPGQGPQGPRRARRQPRPGVGRALS